MKTNEQNRIRINRHVERFLAAGGQIQTIPFGVSAEQDNGQKKPAAQVQAEIKRRDLALTGLL